MLWKLQVSSVVMNVVSVQFQCYLQVCVFRGSGCRPLSFRGFPGHICFIHKENTERYIFEVSLVNVNIPPDLLSFLFKEWNCQIFFQVRMQLGRRFWFYSFVD